MRMKSKLKARGFLPRPLTYRLAVLLAVLILGLMPAAPAAAEEITETVDRSGCVSDAQETDNPEVPETAEDLAEVSSITADDLSYENLITYMIRGRYDGTAAMALLDLVNEARQAQGLSPLAMDADLAAAARERALQLTAWISHGIPAGGDMSANYPLVAAENIAAFQTDAGEVMEDLMASETHRANILDPDCTCVGIACFVYTGGGNESYYWVQDFGSLADITACDASGSESGTFSLTVREDLWPLTLWPENLSLTIGASETLSLLMTERTYGYEIVLAPDSVTFTSTDPEVASVDADGQVKGLSEGSCEILAETAGGTIYSCPVTVTLSRHDRITAFVERLYRVCLERSPDARGLKSWVRQLEEGGKSGAEVAWGFLFSAEFKNKNYCNSHFTDRLYLALFDRAADGSGKSSWVRQLASGTSREAVFNGFIGSDEFTKLCAGYGITRGGQRALPLYGTVPTGPCSICGEADPVTAFVTRLYEICLGRSPDGPGLAAWTAKLRSHQATGREVALGFYFSDEFKRKYPGDEAFLTALYRGMFDRAPDRTGYRSWLLKLENGASRLSIYNGFAGSDEFKKLCAAYGISR